MTTATVRTGSVSQLRALFGLRWQMVRGDGVRAALILVTIGIGWVMLLVARGAGAVDPVQAATAVELAPEAFLGFGVLALIAPLTAGGGNEILPPDQLVAYPIRPRTQFLGGLLLAPVNLVWVLQILALIAETALMGVGGHALPGALTTAAYVTALTAFGQALAWGIAGLRQSRAGRQLVAVVGAVLVVATVVVVKAGLGLTLLAHAPTRPVVAGVLAGAGGDWLRWGLTSAVLLAATVGCLYLGERTCGWALRRPGDSGAVRSSRAMRRRPVTRSALRTLVAMDRASVWRAPALRRGALVLAVLPGVAAAGAQVSWESMVVLPGLVGAGAGLLFGVNAFCLDASGALFLASLPHDPRLLLRAKAIVLTETVFAAAAIAAVAGSLRSPGRPSSTELVAIAVSAVACSAVVVARCLSSSVRRPHKADLRGPRDAVAPPGALALASVRLALPAALVGIALEIASQTGIWWLPPAVAAPVLALSWASVARTFGAWRNPAVRSRVVQTVASG